MLKTRIENRSNNIILFLTGEYDIANYRKFEEMFKAQLKNTDKNIALNLDKLSYIDSSGIVSLVRCINMAKKMGVNLFCYSIPSNIENVFKLSNINHHINIVSGSKIENTFHRKY